ncbi:killer cell lectin-like receptor subfamily F member 2 [Argopecten irradians]|uniref:killer cell lectin-like receptor subfamily F member 2 n=1 Tax=Argopecten irradians TaxID=31199 RepID=UPI00372072D4
MARLLSFVWIGLLCAALVAGQGPGLPGRYMLGAQSQYALVRRYAIDITSGFAALLGAVIAQEHVEEDAKTVKSTAVATSTLANGPNGCPANWHLFNGFCYALTGSIQTYLRTREACLQMGGYLADYENQAELVNIRDNVLQNEAGVFTYIGLNDHIEEANYLNDIVNTMPQFLPFPSGPSAFGPGVGDCGVVRVNFVTTVPCIRQLKGLCKRKQNSVLTYSGL